MKQVPKFLFFASLFLILLWTTCPQAGQWHVSSKTILRGTERELGKDDKKQIVPLYTYLDVGYEDADAGGLSFYLNGWGRKDLAGDDYFEDDPDGELVYGYLQYAKPYSRLRINLGRQHIFSGVTNEDVDGLQFQTPLGPYFTVSLFGGLPAAYDGDDGGDGQSIFGGRLAHRSGPGYEIGISYQARETEAVDNTERAGVDFDLLVGSWLYLSGLSSYNLERQDWREHNYSARLEKGAWALEPTYQYFQYRDYFDTTDTDAVFAFLKENDESIAIAGADLLWEKDGRLQVGLRGRGYEYDLRQESARYLAGLLTINFEGGSQIGTEVGRMDGESAETIYDLYRLFFYWQNPFKLSASGFISADALIAAYDAPVYGEDQSVHYALSAGRGFWNNRVETKLSILFGQDPYFDEDISGVATFEIDF